MCNFVNDSLNLLTFILGLEIKSV